MKRLSRFLPSERIPLQQADDHYELIHHRFAMRMFRDHAPTVRLYATNHAIGQYDLSGTFRRKPAAWRFVIIELPDPDESAAPAGGKEWLPPWAERTIVDDHTNFLREVRPFEVAPTTLVDRRTQQTSLVKYLLEVEAAGDDRAPAAAKYAQISERLAASDAFGLRLAVQNRALREAEMTAVTELGQAYTGRYRDSTTMVGIDELYFDHRDWAEECFRELDELLRPQPGVRIGLYAVEELVGVDRR
jgi:hypothetical protein